MFAVLECSYSDEFWEKTKTKINHLSPTSAGQQAALGNVKTLVLTHIYPSADKTKGLDNFRGDFS
jgi:ribonuclease BN (tRNA processing enzyme)